MFKFLFFGSSFLENIVETVPLKIPIYFRLIFKVIQILLIRFFPVHTCKGKGGTNSDSWAAINKGEMHWNRCRDGKWQAASFDLVFSLFWWRETPDDTLKVGPRSPAAVGGNSVSSDNSAADVLQLCTTCCCCCCGCCCCRWGGTGRPLATAAAANGHCGSFVKYAQQVQVHTPRSICMIPYDAYYMIRKNRTESWQIYSEPAVSGEWLLLAQNGRRQFICLPLPLPPRDDDD